MSSLGGVVASSSRPWGQHVGALIGLLTLGCPALLHSLTPIARSYHNRLAHAIAQAPSPSTRDALDAHTAKCLLLVGVGIVLVLHYLITMKTEYQTTCLVLIVGFSFFLKCYNSVTVICNNSQHYAWNLLVFRKKLKIMYFPVASQYNVYRLL